MQKIEQYTVKANMYKKDYCKQGLFYSLVYSVFQQVEYYVLRDLYHAQKHTEGLPKQKGSYNELVKYEKPLSL